MEKHITKTGIRYELRGEQYYPMIAFGEQTDYEIGKYGKMRLSYLKAHRRGTYTTLLTEGRLNEHLHEIDVRAREQVEGIINQMSERMKRQHGRIVSMPRCLRYRLIHDFIIL